MKPDTAEPAVLVACLCAQWCGVCRDYRQRFEDVSSQVHASHPHVQFLWIDIEDEADLLHPLDVEDFPTVLLARGDQVRYFGPLTPQAQTLVRMIESHTLNDSASAWPQPELVALLARVRQAYPATGSNALPAASNRPSNSTELK